MGLNCVKLRGEESCEPILKVEKLTGRRVQVSLVQSTITSYISLTPGGDVCWSRAGRGGRVHRGQVRDSCPPGASPPLHVCFHHLESGVGIGALSLDGGSRALRQYYRAPRQKTVSRPRALDGRRRRFVRFTRHSSPWHAVSSTTVSPLSLVGFKG